MKKNEIALLILIVSITAFGAFFVGKSIFGDRVSKPVEVSTADPISPTIEQPSAEIFNENAINPTVPIKIGGEGEGKTPFTN